jgi:hypothetical protein
VKGHQIKNHLSVFVNALIENPAFDSQTKETLTTRYVGGFVRVGLVDGWLAGWLDRGWSDGWVCVPGLVCRRSSDFVHSFNPADTTHFPHIDNPHAHAGRARSGRTATCRTSSSSR